MDTLTRMRAFIDVVEAEGFSAAGRKIGRSKALLSKYVRELEDDLGALLLNRTTRQFSLTEAGHTYFRRASEIIQEIDTLSDSVRDSSGEIRGRIKVSAPRTLADAEIGHSFLDFAKDHPDVVLDVRLDDRFVDLVEEGFDMALRITRLQDSSLIAKRLGEFEMRVCVSPGFIEQYGMPESPKDLSRLPCIIDTNMRMQGNWQFRSPEGEAFTVPVSGPIEVNSPAAVRCAAVAGLGVAIAPDFVITEDLETKRLIPIFDGQAVSGGGIYVVYPHRRYQPARVRALIDYLAKWFKNYENNKKVC